MKNLILLSSILAACGGGSDPGAVDSGVDAEKVFHDAMEPPALPTSGNYLAEWRTTTDTCTEGPQDINDTGRVTVTSVASYSIAWVGHSNITDMCMSNTFSATCTSPTIHFTGMPGGGAVTSVINSAATWHTYHTWSDILEEDVSCVGGGCSTSCGLGQSNCQFPCKRVFTRTATWTGP